MNDRTIELSTLRDTEWRTIRVPLGALDRPTVRRFHRVVMAIDHAWIPAERFPGSADHRTLGLQVGTPQLR